MKIKHLLLIVALMTTCLAAEAQTTGEKVKAFADKHLKLSGYLQGGFEWNQANDPETTFYLRRARVSLSGDAAKEKIDYRLQVDFAGSPKICDLYIRYKPLNELNLQLGQYKLPFSLENELYGPTKLEFIEYSYLTTYLVRNNTKYDGISATGRDMGFQLYGGFFERDGYSILNYNVGVYNGAGINCKDNNSSKDFVARLIVKPIKGLSISGSYMYSETEFDGVEYMKSPRWSVGAIYDVRHWIARTEFAQADFGGNTTNAFYALAGYHFEKPWTVAARYEFIDDELNVLDEQRVTIGGVYKPYKFLRLQLNYSYTMNAKLQKNFNGINLMVSAIF
ncbi:MAG: porin [Alistipes sp.]|nr:porin [Alistipes sp.]